MLQAKIGTVTAGKTVRGLNRETRVIARVPMVQGADDGGGGGYGDWCAGNAGGLEWGLRDATVA